jgi:glycosyltransferase involved in cell wall biosynthesis
MINVRPPHLWLAASHYNKDDLVEAGADPLKVFVAPPFNRIESLLPVNTRADYATDTPNLLFVGRLSPNKGHLNLLRLARAFCSDISPNLRLTMVGAIDPELNRYYEQIIDSIRLLQLEQQVEVRSHCSDAELVELFQQAHLYVCLSEHEGFCVPVIEAQAIGVPLIAAAVAAIGETAGSNQLLPQMPQAPEDYSFYAALIHRVMTDERLRMQLVLDGERNVRERFTAEPIENELVAVLYSLLQRSAS